VYPKNNLVEKIKAPPPARFSLDNYVLFISSFLLLYYFTPLAFLNVLLLDGIPEWIATPILTLSQIFNVILVIAYKFPASYLIRKG